MNISFRVGVAGLLVGLGIFSIALHSNAACNLPNNTTVDIALESVQFSNDNVVSSDDGTGYSGTDWEASKKQPVSYKSGEKFKIEAKWTVSKLGLDVSNWRVRGKVTGTEPDNIKIGHTAGGISVTEASQKISMAATEAETAFLADKVKYYPNFSIEWEFSFDEGKAGTWKACSTGANDNLMYITLGEPESALNLYHTALHIGCKASDGNTDHGEIVTSVWGAFSDGDVRVVNPATGDFMGNAMSFLLDADPDNPTGSIGSLLTSVGGNCAAWEELFRATVKMLDKTINVQRVKVVPKTANEVMLMKGWTSVPHIRTGSNGVLNSTCDEENDMFGDKIKETGNGEPDAPCIASMVPSNPAVTTPTPDDEVSNSKYFILTGDNGICNTTASGTDFQGIDVGNGKADTIGILPGSDKIIDSTKHANDVLGNEMYPGTTYPHRIDVDFFYTTPNPDKRQGTSNSSPFYTNHFITKYGGTFYDPSYCIKETSERLYEMSAVVGYRLDPSFEFEGVTTYKCRKLDTVSGLTIQ